MKLIPKFQEPSGPINDNYYYQTTDTTDGTVYNIHPSAIGAKNLEVTLPETVVKAPRRYEYRSAYHPEDTFAFANILTGNILGRLSPTQNIRAVYDTFDKNLTTEQKLNSWFQGNNGVVADKYAQKHPYLSMAVNAVGDAGTYATVGALRVMPAWARKVQAQNAKEAAARWQGIQNAVNYGKGYTLGDNVTLHGNPKPSTMTWGKAQTIAQYSKTGSPYENMMGKTYEIDRGPWKSKKAFSGPRFGDYIGSGGEQIVYQDTTNPNKVLKVNVNNNLVNLDELRSFNKDFPKSRNIIPFQEPIKLEGFVTEGQRMYPVYSQNKVSPFKRGAYFQQHIFPRIQNSLQEIGFDGDGVNSSFRKGKVQLIDMNPENMGMDKSGRIRFIDVSQYQ